MKSIRRGYAATVTIPVEDGAVHTMTVRVGEDSYTVERSSVLVLREGGAGFSFRGTVAAVSEVYIVNGCGYAEKTGDASSYTVEPPPESKRRFYRYFRRYCK